MGVFLVVFLYAVWSSVFSIGKMTLAYTSPLFLTGTRMVFAGILLLAFLALFKRKLLVINKKQIISLLALSFFSIYLSNALEFWGQKYLLSAKTCFIYSLSPLFAALFSYIHFKEKMNREKWIGVAISLVGFVPVLQMQTGAEELLNAFSFFSWPTLAVIGAALAAVYGWTLLRLIVKDQEISPIMANGSSMLVGGILALGSSLFFDGWNPLPIASGSFTPFLHGVLLLTVISNILCYNLYGWLLKRFTSTFLSFMGLLSPIFASLHGFFFLGEPLSWTLLLSTGIVCLGLAVVYRAELKQGYILGKKAPA